MRNTIAMIYLMKAAVGAVALVLILWVHFAHAQGWNIPNPDGWRRAYGDRETAIARCFRDAPEGNARVHDVWLDRCLREAR